jgi:hypothetical protein
MRLEEHVTFTPCLNTGSHEWGYNKAIKVRLKSVKLRNYTYKEGRRINCDHDAVRFISATNYPHCQRDM